MGFCRGLDRIPEFGRFIMSGMIGTILDFIAYKFLYESSLFPYFKATLSWTVAYAMSVVWQHALHALLVFGSFGNHGYCRSLGATYMAYSMSIVFSPFINWSLVEYARMHHTPAWIATLALTGLTNYVLLSRQMSHVPQPLVILTGGVPISDAMRAGGLGASHSVKREGSSKMNRRPPDTTPGPEAPHGDESVTQPPQLRMPDGPGTPHRQQTTVVTIGSTKNRSLCVVS